jgi:hypothetical protein
MNRVPFNGIFFDKVDQRKESANRRSRKSKKFRPKGRGMENVLLANPWFPLQAYIFRPKGRGITPKLLLKISGNF